MALQGTKVLEKWCQRVTDGYDGVKIVNMSTSWRNGLGFCALIHHFHPELIIFDALDPDDAEGNNRLAFSTAEQHLGIPALLDPKDMAESELLDRLSILTYLAQFYQAFHGATGPVHHSTSPRVTSAVANSAALPSSATGTPISLLGRGNEACNVCHKAVFIMERLNVAGRLLHRTCFKCARCQHQLNVHNYYETERGEYCCDVCPDEEKTLTDVVEANKMAVLGQSGGGQIDARRSSLSSEGGESEDSAPECQRIEKHVKQAEKEQDLGEKEEDAAENNNKASPELNNTASHRSTIDANANDIAAESQSLDAAEVQEEEQAVLAVDSDSAASSDKKSDGSATDEHNSNISANDQDEEAEPAEAQSEDQPSEPADEKQAERTTTPQPAGESSERLEADSNVVAQADADADYPDDLNPFGDDDDEEDEKEDLSSEALPSTKQLHNEKNAELKSVSTNPFGSDFEDSEDETVCGVRPSSSPVPAAATSVQGPPKPPRVSLNPFGSDFEDDDDDEEEEEGEDVPSNNISSQSVSFTLKSPSTTPVSESCPRRKKRQAPKPPGVSPSVSPRRSPRVVRPAPAPPRGASPTLSTTSTLSAKSRPPPPRPPPPLAEKERKERDNLHRRSRVIVERPDTVSIASADSSLSSATASSSSMKVAPPPKIVLTPLSPDKAAQDGQWKKKKGPAPPRPIPQKRQVKKLPRKAVNTELHDIEVKQQELERQGVKLERSIRELCEKSDRERAEKGLNNNDRDSLGPEVEDLIVQLFDLVNEKNDLFRRQTELMYMKRDHRLEEEHADTEHQIRLLMAKPDAQRSAEDKVLEEKLISRLMEIVGQRNEIVDCLEMDRLREREEDESFELHIGEYAAIKPAEGIEANQKKKKERKKEKKKRKKDKNFDADKDIDTSELPSPRASPKKSSLGVASGFSPLEKERAKKLKKKLMASFTVTTMKKDREKGNTN